VSPRPDGPAEQVRLRIDPAACDGIGMCAHLAPRLVSVDDWGYPILPRHPLSLRDARAAVVAVASCPRRALFVAGPDGR
jgi:ferredoxin